MGIVGVGNFSQQDGTCRNRGTPGGAGPVIPAWASTEMHPDAIEGDCFDDFADLDAWAATLPARFPGGVVYSHTGSIATTPRSYRGNKVYTLDNGNYLELNKDLGQAYDAVWQRAILYVPRDVVLSFNRLFALGCFDTVADNASSSILYDPVAESWRNSQTFGGDRGTPPDVPFAFANLAGAWHVWISRTRNPGGASPMLVDFWLDGVFQFLTPVDWSPDPMPTTGVGYLDMYYGLATAGSKLSMAMWEVVPGTNPYNLAEA